jgi:hypothetical protein
MFHEKCKNLGEAMGREAVRGCVLVKLESTAESYVAFCRGEQLRKKETIMTNNGNL